ncbi:CdaR family protein [uncultured Leuconostoc sp.]|uniref:CdaR family protein n=1 Tax=uncultured Leuconostoc sp. TaxID=173262 RepID=UPI0025D715F9|nr:CdaR family protein [uncultured Leuconostoc sp.]
MKKVKQSKIVNLSIAFVIAILLSSYVSSTRSTRSAGSDSNNFSTLIPEKKATLKVALNVQFDNDKYVVIGAPTTVQVDIEGSGALVSAAKSRNDIQASIDLRGLKAGKRTATVALRGVNASLTSTVNPQKITVTIARKTSATVPVNVSYNKDNIAKGYTASEPTTNPKNVTISGPKSNVDAVTSVAARLNLPSGVKESLTRTAQLVALDKDGNTVEVNFSRQTVDATLAIAPEDSKRLTLNASVKNGESNNYQITFDPKTVTAYGSSDILNAMDNISVSVDISNIRDGGTVNAKLPSIDGIVRYDKTDVTATVSQIKNSSGSTSESRTNDSSNTSSATSSSASASSDAKTSSSN